MHQTIPAYRGTRSAAFLATLVITFPNCLTVYTSNTNSELHVDFLVKHVMINIGYMLAQLYNIPRGVSRAL